MARPRPVGVTGVADRVDPTPQAVASVQNKPWLKLHLSTPIMVPSVAPSATRSPHTIAMVNDLVLIRRPQHAISSRPRSGSTSASAWM